MYYTGEKYYHTITIDHTKVPANVTNMSVILTAANFNNDIKTLGGGSAPRTDGGDIRFCSDVALANPLAFDLISYTQNATPANAQVEIVVNVGTVSSTVDTVIYVTWGDSTLTKLSASDTYGQYNAYKSGFKFWCPMRDDPDTSHVKDRTTNQLSGTKKGAANPAQSTSSAQIYESELFVNSNGSWITVPAFNTGSQFTVFSPFNFTNASGGHGDQVLISNKIDYGDATGFEYTLLDSDNRSLNIVGANSVNWSPTPFTNIITDGWETLAVRFNGANLDVFNKTVKTSGTGVITSVANSTTAITIGMNTGHDEASIDARMDNVIFYIGALTDGEIQAMQNNQMNPSTFVNAVGATISISTGGLMRKNELFDNMSNLNM